MENKARKSTVVYNGIELEVYQLPNGEYHLSKTQVGKAIEKRDFSLPEWLAGKSPEALPYKDFSFPEISIEGVNTTFHSVPLNMAAAYWTYWSQRGNALASALVATSVVESLTRLCNTAFGVKTNETQIAQANVENMDTNKALFQVMSMLQGMTERMDNMTNQLAETNAKYDNLQTEKLQLIAENAELAEFKEEVEVYPEFLRLLEIANNEISELDYPNGVTCRKYIEENNIPLLQERFCTLSRRTAGFYRSIKGRNPERRGCNNIYRSTDVAFIIATLYLMMRGL